MRSRTSVQRCLGLLLAMLMVGPLASGAAAAESGAPGCSSVVDKILPWRSGDLRGANIWQGRWSGSSNPHAGRTIGNPINQTDLDELRQLGANYLQLSVAGLYTEQPPYILDAEAQQVIDNIVEMASRAGLFVVIAFRSGPGRNEQAVVRSSDVAIYGAPIEDFWVSGEAQDAWLEMLRSAAVRYGSNPAVIGIGPMVEPNAYVRYGFQQPKDFYAKHGNTLEDINQFNVRATAAIRSSSDVPIILEGDGYGSIGYLPYLAITGDPRTVYSVHYYEPIVFTIQPAAGRLRYPGRMPIGGEQVIVDKEFQERALQPLSTFKRTHGVPIAITEFGVHRYAPGAAGYLSDALTAFEKIGASHALWEFVVAAQRPLFNDFDPAGGPDENVRARVYNPVQAAVEENLDKNCARLEKTDPPGSTNGFGPSWPTHLWLWTALSILACAAVLATVRLATRSP